MKYCKWNLKITNVSMLAEWWSALRSGISSTIELPWLLLACGLINNQKYNFNWYCFLVFWLASLYFRYFNIPNHVIFYIHNIQNCKREQYFSALNIFDIFITVFKTFICRVYFFTIKMLSVIIYCIFFLINYVSFWINMETVSWYSLQKYTR